MRKQVLNVFYQGRVFRADPSTNMAALASDWLTHFRLHLCKCWTDFDETLLEASTHWQHPLPRLCFLGRSCQQIWLSWPLIGWNIFNISSGTFGRILTKLYRKQVLNILYRLTVFRANPSTNMAALVSDLLKHFQLLLCKRWADFYETLQESNIQYLLPILYFSGQSIKHGCPGLWLANTFLTPLQPLYGFQWNLTGSNYSRLCLE